MQDPWLEAALLKLRQTTGIAKCKILTDKERELARRLETSGSVQDQLLGMRMTNEGITDVLSRTHVVLIAHTKDLRHPPGPIVVIRDNGNIIGEEVWETDQLSKFSADPNAILLGKSLVLFRDVLANARGKILTLTYRALPFPELDEVDLISSVVSVTIGPLTHIRLSQTVGWDSNNPDLGTVLVGLNRRV